MIRYVIVNQSAVREKIRGLGCRPGYCNRRVTIYVPRPAGRTSLRPFTPVTPDAEVAAARPRVDGRRDVERHVGNSSSLPILGNGSVVAALNLLRGEAGLRIEPKVAWAEKHAGLQAHRTSLAERIRKLRVGEESAPPAGFTEQRVEPFPLDNLRGLDLRIDEQSHPSPVPCGPAEVSRVEHRGFRLGLTAEAVRARLPGLAVPGPRQVERDQRVNELSSGAKTRAQVLRAVVENPALIRAESNRAFVFNQLH